jgi:signal transduction histidine kinase/DNA-binding response OmpR family regulator
MANNGEEVMEENGLHGHLTVLLVEDNPADAKLIQRMLSGQLGPSLDLQWYPQLSQALEYLGKESADIILLDLSLQESHGLNTLQEILPAASHLPIIVLTGNEEDLHAAIKAVRTGAQDFLMKSQIDGNLLVRAIRYAIERKQIREALLKAHDQLEEHVRERTAELRRVNKELTRVNTELVCANEALRAEISERKHAEREREWLLAAERGQRILAETLRETTSVLNTSLHRDRVLQLILEQLARVVDYDSTSVMLVSEDTLDVITYRSLSSGRSPASPLEIANLTHVQKVLEGGRPVIIANTYRDDRWRVLPGSEDIHCWMGVPLMVHDRVIGLLNINKEQPGFYTQHHAELAQAFANHAAIAIENARLYEDLQQQMETLKYTQAQLVQSAKLAAVGELAAGVAHELNNPLTTILGFAELMWEDASDDTPYRRDLEDIASEAQRARDIVRNLLDFARQSEACKEMTNINQIIRETTDMIRYHLEKSGLIIEEDYATGIGLIALDSRQMKQVFLNLLSNAVQSMPNGGRLSLCTARIGNEIAVSIGDTGIGIPVEIRERIFDPFFTTKASGTGLGLSVSRGIVQEHGGRITVESEERRGSTFTVWLPLNRQ